MPKGAHDVYPHPLLGEHNAPTALAGWQIDPHVPQLETLIGVSQPLVLSPSQSRYPAARGVCASAAAGRADRHVTCSGLQRTPQPPQFERPIAVSHPLLGLPSQSR